MPPKARFTAEGAQEFGDLAASKAADSLGRSVETLQLTCTYRGTVDAEGHVDPAGQIARRTALAYEWRAARDGAAETAEVKVGCGNASSQGVPLPSTWTTALKCQELPSLIGQAVEAAQK